MNKKLLPSCPYCGNKPTFLDAWLAKSQGEYRCPDCRNVSDIVFKDRLYKNFIKTTVLSVAILIISLLLPFRLPLLETTLIVLLYALFYIRVPEFMSFEPINHGRNRWD